MSRDITTAANLLWALATPVLQSPVHDYLETRGFGESDHHSNALKFEGIIRGTAIRCLPALSPAAAARLNIPLHYADAFSMLAAVRELDGALTAVQLSDIGSGEDWTWRRPDTRRAIIGSVGRSAIQLAMPQPGETLALAVSVESALSVYERFGIPTWAVLDANRFASVTLPRDVSEIRLFPDDEETFKAAHTAEEELNKRGYEVTRTWPSPVTGKYKFHDWADCVKWLKEDQDDGWELGG